MPELFDVTTYDFTKVANILDIGDTYQAIAKVQVLAAPSGVYYVGLSVQGVMGDTNDAAFLRFSTNNGTSWYEFRRTAARNADTFGAFYAFPVQHAGGDIQFEIEARKETGGNQFDINFADVWIHRVN